MCFVRFGLIVLLAALAVVPARAAELVLFETAGCSWCEAWDRDIGGIYHLTDEARILTLRRVELRDPMPPDLRHIPDIVYTPTFVVIDKGREIGRILGYNGEDHFWGLLGEIIKNLPQTQHVETRESS